MRIRSIVAAGLVAGLSSAAVGAPPRTQSVMLPMSDGVKLATDVHLPAGDGPFPVILARTPYNKNRRGAAGWVRRGYAVVQQDMRGRFGSEGENVPFIGCGWAKYRDGAETLDWIRRQPWCGGKVGTHGGSAGGITQNLLAAAGCKGLTCQYVVVAAASLYHHAAYPGGALRQSQVVGWMTANRFDPKALVLYAAHPDYDAFWRGFDAVGRAEKVAAPAVHVGGWFDTFSQGTVDAFVSRQTRGAPGARGAQKLVMGPWAHGRLPGGRVGELRFPRALPPRKYSAAAWFDCHLKGRRNGVRDLPAVAYYVMGDTAGGRDAPGNEWRYAKAWPVPATDTPYHLHPGGRLDAARPPASDGKPTRVSYTFDPTKPCPTVGGCNLMLPKGPMDQRKVESRKDVLCFTTDPLTAPVEVTGNVRARLFVACSAADTDLSVRFCDVYPDGASYLMAEGMLRLRYRDGFARPTPLKPGEVVEATVTCWPTSVVINEGHRIRVSITGSNAPRFDVNPGTGRPWRPGCRTVLQAVGIYCDGDHPSRVILPVVAAK